MSGETRIDKLQEMAQLLHTLADGMEKGKITYIPGASYIETMWSTKVIPGKGKVRSGYKKLNLLYYDPAEDETPRGDDGPTVINLKIDDSNIGSEDDH